MRRVLFCHCGFVNKVGNDYYVSCSYSDDALSRFFLLGDEIELVVEQGRRKDCERSQQYTKSTLNNLTITPIPKIGKIKELINLRKRRQIVKEAVKRADIIVARMPSGAGCLAIKYAKKYSKPYMIEVVGCVWDSLFNYNWKGKLLAWFKWSQMKRIVWRAPYTVYVSNEFLQKRYPCNGKTVAISNVIVKRSLQDNFLSDRERRLKTKDKNAKFVLGTAANVSVPYKGQGLVIRALGELKRRGITNIEYQLAGSGDSSLLREIARRENVENQVSFKGGIDHSEISNWYKSLDCYIQPSYQEGLCRAVVEAMFYALPCIVSNVGGNPELIDSRFVFEQKINDKKKIEKIADLIIQMTNERTSIEQSEQNYRKSTQYDLELLNKRRQDFYQDFIDRFYGDQLD